MAKRTNKKNDGKGNAVNEEINEVSPLDAAFDAAEETDAEFTPEQPEEVIEETVEETTNTSTASKVVEQVIEAVDPNEAFLEEMKAKFFVGLFLYLLAGANMFLLNMMHGTEVPMEKLEFSDPEKAAVTPYMKTPQIMAWLKKLPPWLVGVMHVEYIFIRKFNAVKKDFKKVKKEKTDKSKK